MTTKGEPIPYTPLPPHPTTLNYVVLPRYHHRHHHYHRIYLSAAAALLLIYGAVFLLWPSDPELKLARAHLNNLQIQTSPQISLNVSLLLTISVQNRDLFSLDYDSLGVAIGYRGRELGFASSDGGSLKARGRSYVNATLELDGIEVLHDVIYLIQDLAKGLIPFETVSDVSGKLGFFFFPVPLKAKVSCEIEVSTSNQTVVRQACSPE